MVIGEASGVLITTGPGFCQSARFRGTQWRIWVGELFSFRYGSRILPGRAPSYPRAADSLGAGGTRSFWGVFGKIGENSNFGA